MLAVKRAYEERFDTDGFRVLVDRLWPRGLSKEKAGIDLWLKEIAPSNELRKWFGHEPEKWEEFRKRYLAELRGNPGPVAELRGIVGKGGKVTLVHGAKDEERNQAVALRDLLSRRKA